VVPGSIPGWALFIGRTFVFIFPQLTIQRHINLLSILELHCSLQFQDAAGWQTASIVDHGGGGQGMLVDIVIAVSWAGG
jgi:hypothetical protein